MRAMRAEEFSGYKGLKLVDLPKPAGTEGKVLLRITAAGVTPLERMDSNPRYRMLMKCCLSLRWCVFGSRRGSGPCLLWVESPHHFALE